MAADAKQNPNKRIVCKGAKSNADEAAVHQEVGDGEQLVRVRAGVSQRKDLQVSLLQLHVSSMTFATRTILLILGAFKSSDI